MGGMNQKQPFGIIWQVHYSKENTHAALLWFVLLLLHSYISYYVSINIVLMALHC